MQVWENPDIDLLAPQALQSLLYKRGTVLLIFKELDHVDDELWIDLVELLLQLLHRVQLELAKVYGCFTFYITNLILQLVLNTLGKLDAPIEIEDGYLFVTREHLDQAVDEEFSSLL